MNSLRVLYVSDKIDFIGGGEISLLHLMNGLRAGGDVETVLTVPEPGELSLRAEAQNIPFVIMPLPRVRFRLWSLLHHWKQSKRVIREIEPDILHVNNARSMLIAGIAGVRCGIPVVWHVRVEGHDLFDRWLSSKASLIITPSRAVAARYPGADVRVIPNPVPVLPIGTGGQAREQLRSQHLQGKEFLLLTVAELVPKKGHLRVLEALSRLDRDFSWRLLICGRESSEGPGFRSELEATIIKWGLQDRVRLLGFREDVADLMLASDLLIHAPDTEGFGRVFIEAMATGLPVVVTPAGGLKELHDNTGFGWITDDMTPAELERKIDLALRSGRERESFRSRGPVIAKERYSVEMHAARVLDLYHELLGSSGSTTGTPA
jgi:glycosyltransferase involved in cell wall biosynthesis